MRVNLRASIPIHLYRHRDLHRLPLVLTIKTAHGLAAGCECRTTAFQLLWTLYTKTDINGTRLYRFQEKLRLIEEATLRNVEVSDEVLRILSL